MDQTPTTTRVRIDHLTVSQVCDLRDALMAAGIAAVVDLKATYATWNSEWTADVRAAVAEKHERKTVHRMPTVALSSLLRKIDAAAQR